MSILINLLIFAVSIFVLAKSSDKLVSSASGIARKYNIPDIVIGLTIVAFGTSAPELVVSITSALSGSTEIALGNAVGSNIFNILGVLGICSLIYPLTIKSASYWKEIPLSLAGAFIVLIASVMKFLDLRNFSDLDWTNNTTPIATIGLGFGLILLVLFVIFMYYIVGQSKGEKLDLDVEIDEQPIWQGVLWILLSLVGLALSSKFAVDSAVFIGTIAGISKAVIGLTIVSIGTSLPEMFTSISAVRQKNTDIAVGNIVGSNIFNIFLVLGTTSLIKNIPVTPAQVVDTLVLIFTTLLLMFLLMINKRYQLGKFEGVVMILMYLAYTTYLIMQTI